MTNALINHFPASNVVPLEQARKNRPMQALPSLPPTFQGSANLPGFHQTRGIKFAASLQISPQIQATDTLIRTLKQLDNESDPSGDKRAVIAEYLGRSHVLSAKGDLLKLMAEDNPVTTRTSAFEALGRLASVGNYSRVEIGEQIMQAFPGRVQNLGPIIQQGMKAQIMTIEGLEKDPKATMDVREFLADLRKTSNKVELLEKEIVTAAKALGQASYPDTRQFLKQNYGQLVQGIEQITETSHSLETALKSAKSRFIDQLIREVKNDDIEEVLANVPSQILDELLNNGTLVTMADGTEMPFKQAVMEYVSLQKTLEVNNKIAGALVQGITQNPTGADIAGIRQSVKTIVNPTATANALEALAPYRALEFREIDQYLKTPSPEVRRAAVKNLMNSQESAGKKKLLDLLNPYQYLNTVGLVSSMKQVREVVDLYYQALLTVVVRGDEFIEELNERVLSVDADLPSRKMAIMALGYMTQKPFSEDIHPATRERAKNTLSMLSSHAPGSPFPLGRTSAEANEIRLMATQVSLQAKDPQAVGTAIDLMTHPAYANSPKQKEQLLSAIYKAMLEDYEEVRKDNPGSPDDLSPFKNLILPDSMKRQILDAAFDVENMQPEVLEQMGFGEEKTEKLQGMLNEYKDTLGPDKIDRMLAPDFDENVPLSSHARREAVDTKFVTILKKSLDNLRPELQNLLIDPQEEGSVKSRALSAQVLGLLGDRQSVDPLIETARDPFKGKQNWQRFKSHIGTNPAVDALTLKSSVLTALGRIGDARAVDVMLGALDDPFLDRHVVESPLALLAKDLNDQAQSRSPQKVVEALLEIPPDELGTRLQQWLSEVPPLEKALTSRIVKAAMAEVQKEALETGQEPPERLEIEITPDKLLQEAINMLRNPKTQEVMMKTPIGALADEPGKDTPELKKVREKLKQVIENPRNTRLQRYIRLNAANTLMQFNGGAEAIKDFIATTKEPNFRRQAISALISNDYALDPSHPDHDLVKTMLAPELNVAELHEAGFTGKGVDLAIVDGGYVQKNIAEAFQDRVKLPPGGTRKTLHTHPTMVATTAAGNGAIKGVAPESTIYSDAAFPRPNNDNLAPFRHIIEGKLRGENNVRVINNSWGTVDDNVYVYKPVREHLQELKKLVELAELANVQIVFSAGNSGEDPYIPGLGSMTIYGADVDKLTHEEKADLDYVLDKVITVGASNTQGYKSTRKHVLADFSSRGDSMNPLHKPTVVAPGVDMPVYSYENGQTSKELVNGTSFSGPFAAGVLTLMAQANPDLTNEEMREILKDSATPLSGLSEAQQGAGQVNPKKAVKMAEAMARKGKS